MDREQIIEKKLHYMHCLYDEKEHLMTEFRETFAGGYHTKRIGKLHPISHSVDYAGAILLLKRKKYYDQAIQTIMRICDLQDLREESKTHGLWSYYLEEPIDSMEAPDYNWADFIGKNLLGVYTCCKDLLTNEQKEKLKIAIRAAVECSIKRNVAADYTNIRLMSNLVIVTAGEQLNDDRLFQLGKERLTSFYQYTKFNGTFTEYNSSSYMLVAMNEIARMLRFFQDKECRAMAEELNEYVWDCFTRHYNRKIGQLTPPQMRAYRDFDHGALGWYLYQGTEGRYGFLPSMEKNHEVISLESLVYPSVCPKECEQNLKEVPSWLVQTYYKKNQLRHPGEDTTIILDLDSHDLKAFSYRTEQYSMGVFDVCDTWNQRRNSMILWGKENPCCLRLRCMIDNYDFCSGIIYASQYKNTILGALGFTTDRGSFHYILDKVKDGRYELNHLSFRFEFTGKTSKLHLVEKKGKGRFLFETEELYLMVDISRFLFDGRDGLISYHEKEGYLELLCYQGEKKRIDLHKLDQTYGIYSMRVIKKDVWTEKESVEDKSLLKKSAKEILTMDMVEPQIEIKKDKMTTRLNVDDQTLVVTSPLLPVTYHEAVQIRKEQE